MFVAHFRCRLITIKLFKLIIVLLISSILPQAHLSLWQNEILDYFCKMWSRLLKNFIFCVLVLFQFWLLSSFLLSKLPVVCFLNFIVLYDICIYCIYCICTRTHTYMWVNFRNVKILIEGHILKKMSKEWRR